MFTIPDAGALQGTPVVAGGDHVRDRAERVLSRSTPAAGGRSGTSSGRGPRASRGGGANRGAAVAGDRVFMVTDNAHIIALNRFTGELLWDTELADWRQNYAASSAPLPAGNLVISGVSGGEHGANGFVAAHDQETGKEVWRFWTVPEARRSPDRKRGRGRTSSTAARRPGSPAATTPRSTSSTGRSATRARSTTATIARATTSMPTRSWRSSGKTGALEVALPVHAARSVGLGRDADVGARRRRLGGAARVR